MRKETGGNYHSVDLTDGELKLLDAANWRGDTDAAQEIIHGADYRATGVKYPRPYPFGTSPRGFYGDGCQF